MWRISSACENEFELKFFRRIINYIRSENIRFGGIRQKSTPIVFGTCEE